MGHGFDWAWSGLGLVFTDLSWTGLRILEPIPNTGLYLSSIVSYVDRDNAGKRKNKNLNSILA